MKTLEDVFQYNYVKAKESGKQSAGHLTQIQGANAIQSQYCKAKQIEQKHWKR